MSRRAVQRAAAVRRANPKLHAKVLAGKTTLSDATRAITEPPLESNGAENQSEKQLPAGVAEESRDRKKCITQFKVFVKEQSKELHRPQKEIQDFIRVFLYI